MHCAPLLRVGITPLCNRLRYFELLLDGSVGHGIKNFAAQWKVYDVEIYGRTWSIHNFTIRF